MSDEVKMVLALIGGNILLLWGFMIILAIALSPFIALDWLYTHLTN